MKTRRSRPRGTALAAFHLAALAILPAQEPGLKIGLVGLDNSHVGQFAEVMHNPAHKEHVSGARFVCAYKGGSPDIEHINRCKSSCIISVCQYNRRRCL